MKYLSELLNSVKHNVAFCISLAGSFILHLFFAWQPLDRLEGFCLARNNGPLIDDSYIFFKISSNLADWVSGFLPTIQVSSGFQPLIAFLYAPFFHLFWDQKELSIHLALSLNAFLGFLSAILFYSLLRKIVNRAIATFLISVWIWTPYVMNQTINGMETTLAFLLLLIVISYYWRINDNTHSTFHSWFLLGLLLGLGFWARVDFGMLGLAVALDQIWSIVQNEKSMRPIKLRNISLCSVTALAVAAPWIIFTVLRTGDFIPISGKAVHQITTVLLNRINPNHPAFSVMMFSFFQKEFLLNQPFSALFNNIAWQLLVVGFSLVGLILAIRDQQLRSRLRFLWIFQVFIVLSYIIFVGGYWHFYRYFFPVFSLMLFLHAVNLRFLVAKLKLQQSILVTVLFLLLIPFVISYSSNYQSLWSRKYPPRFLSAALYIKDKISPEVKIGSFQSGCLSYWLDNQVVNLDGVTNENAYFHLKNKTMDSYLNELQVNYIVEEVYLFKMWDNHLGSQLSKNFTKVGIKKPDQEPLSLYTWGIYKRNF
jgi:hypothetical protein